MLLQTKIESILLLTVPLCLFTSPAIAQISSDGTIETKVTSADGKNFDIDRGTRVGDNLFHSFKDFSVPDRGSANFNNALDVRNIINRVTGGSVSTIDGLIKAKGSANLFLINPAGIIFGKGASLDIGGSFLGSTASNILFKDGTNFSTTDNLTKPLLTVSAPIGLQFRDNPTNITNRSVNNNVGLQVKPGATLSLIGGNLNLDGGILTASAGKIELGGLSAAGTVTLNNGNVSFPEDIAKADISLSNLALVDVTASGGGSIDINARNLTLSALSNIAAGIKPGLGNSQAKAGDIKIQTSNAIKIGQSSGISNRVDENATGTGGNIEIETTSLNATEGAFLSTSLFGKGDGGDIIINAKDAVSLDGIDELFFSSGIFSSVSPLAEGKGGNVKIEANSLSLTNSGTIVTETVGKGNADNITLDIRDGITISGFEIVKFNEVDTGFFSAITSQTRDSAEGNGGDINIKARSLSLDNYSLILATTTAQGKAGNISIQVDTEIKLNNFSLIRNGIEYGGVGNAGNIDIKTRSLSLTKGGQIASGVRLEENGIPGGKGEGGDINITATESVNLAGFSDTQLPIFNPLTPDKILPTEGYSSAITSETERGATGTAGNIVINTGDFRIADGAVIESSTTNDSNAGNITINAENFEAIDGGQIISSTRSGGNAGDIKLNVDNDLTITGSDPGFANRFERAKRFGNPEDIVTNIGNKSGLFANSTADATGESGNISIDPQQVTIADDGIVSVNSQGKGNGGSLFINADSLSLDDRGSLNASTTSGTGGNITLKIEDLVELDGNSTISARAFENASGGNITIDTQSLVAYPQQNSDIIANAEVGRGGNIDIIAKTIFGIAEEQQSFGTNDIDASSQAGVQGTVSIETPDIDNNENIVKLPEDVVEPDPVVAQACSASDNLAKQSRFSIIGRGGLPTDPTQPLTHTSIEIAKQNVPENNNSATNRFVTKVNDDRQISSEEVIPARGMFVNDRGEVVLTRYPTNNKTQRTPTSSSKCTPDSNSYTQ